MARPAVQMQLIQSDGTDALDLRQAFERGAVAEQQCGATVAEHVSQALGRVVDIQRHIGATGLEDGQQTDHQLWRAFRAMATRVSGPTPLSRR